MGTRRHTAPATTHKETARFAGKRALVSGFHSVGLLAIGASLCLAAFFTGCLSGCRSHSVDYDWHGQEELLAVYQMGTLYATVPPEVSVHSVVAAAQMVLERRGYTLTAVESTDDQGHVIARPADGRTISKVRVSVRLVDGGTALSIRTYPGGNEHAARDIFERILTRLGL